MPIPDETLKEWADKAFAEHELTIVKDDGLYHHWRCRNPATWAYGFHIVTWPGYLCLAGDIGCWTFSREPDMIEWFESDHGSINPHYWSEKLQDGHERARNRRFLEEPEMDEEYGFEMPAGTSVDDGWNPQFIYACHGIVLAIKLYRAATLPKTPA
jgi:hypothetical protein